MSHAVSQNIEQQRAASALFSLQEYNTAVAQKLEKGVLKQDPRSEYLSAIKALPAAILQNGLGQTLASYRAAKTDGPKDVYQHLESWLCSKAPHAPFDQDDQLLQALVTHDQNTYIAAQTEALAYTRWLKKLAIAEFPALPNEPPNEPPPHQSQ
jgi:CRISPR type III-B/RAMP module-associated protein Cmr5